MKVIKVVHETPLTARCYDMKGNEIALRSLSFSLSGDGSAATIGFFDNETGADMEFVTYWPNVEAYVTLPDRVYEAIVEGIID